MQFAVECPAFDRELWYNKAPPGFKKYEGLRSVIFNY
jgi:hypothetical protein